MLKILTQQDFQYHFLKVSLISLTLSETIKNIHFKSLQTNLKSNLENRLAIVEELKS
jgi:hypothetical protein